MDKEKLLIWLEKLAEANALSQAFYAIDEIVKEINAGTFDKEVTP